MFFGVQVWTHSRRWFGIFSAPEPKAQVHYCDHALSAIHPSLTFHISNFSETAERNSTKLDRKQDLNVFYQVCVFLADRKNKMAALASDWLRQFRLLLWTEFKETWQEARSQRPLPSLCFSGRWEKQDGRPGLWLAETFSTSPLKPLNQFNETWQKARSQCPLPSLCFSGRSEKQDWPDWPRHFRLLLWNRWMEFNETWQEARSQRPLPSLCFSGQSEKQDGRSGFWLAETFSSSPLKPLNRIQQNLTGSKISTSSSKFVFFRPIGKTRWPPWPLIGWDIFDFSSETAEWNSPKLDRKQDLNVFYQVRVFRADESKTKQKLQPWPICQKGGTLYSGARYVALLASCLEEQYTLWHVYSENCAPSLLQENYLTLKYVRYQVHGKVVQMHTTEEIVQLKFGIWACIKL